MVHRRRDRAHFRSVGAVVAFVLASLPPVAGNAYTAAGDRNFPATLILPQVAPSDAFWGNFSAQPTSGGLDTLFEGNYSKTITERLGIQFSDGLYGLTRNAAVNGAQNLNVQLQYEAIDNQPHEFVLSVQVDHNFGASSRFPPSPSTTPAVTFAKGLGDLPIGYGRPLAITGYAGCQISEGSRLNAVDAGFSVQYSIPYLLSKVANVDLPPLLRGMTPITEVMYTAASGPGRNSHDQGTQVVVAPGISYSGGSGWELGVEALVPATRAAGSRVGVIAQLVVQLDYLLPDSIFGRPIFPLQ